MEGQVADHDGDRTFRVGNIEIKRGVIALKNLNDNFYEEVRFNAPFHLTEKSHYDYHRLSEAIGFIFS